MADPRRSARSTKGVNSRLSDVNIIEAPSPAPSKRRKSTPKSHQASEEQEGTPGADDDDDKTDDIIRCVCGAKEEDEDDDRMMIQCEGCDAWQHTQCMGIPKKKIPKQYFCEICKPDMHSYLLEQMALGEKPWEKKPGKKKKAPLAKEKKEPAAAGKGARRSKDKDEEGDEKQLELEPEPEKMDIDEPEAQEPAPVNDDTTAPMEEMPPPVELKNGKSLPPIVTQSPAPMKGKKEQRPKKELATPKSAKRKASHDSDGEFKMEDAKEPEKKIRRVSVVPTTPTMSESPAKNAPPSRRQSIATPKAGASAKKQQQKDDTTPQMELVNSIAELRNHNRQAVANYLVIQVTDHAKRLAGEGKLKLPSEAGIGQLCENRALQIEHRVYLNHFAGGDILPEYQKRARSIGFNLKTNPALTEEILLGRLSCKKLSTMTTEEMASKELKEFTQQVRLESEKQHTLINETGPRIRRTHKGEELVDDMEGVAQQDTLLESGNVIRRNTEPFDDTPLSAISGPALSPTSPGEASMSPTTADAVETPRSPSHPPPASEPTPVPPTTDKPRSFSIENVWSHVESPDVSSRPVRPPTHTPTPIPQQPPSKIDKDIDNLLKDTDDGTPPYSPHEDGYSPPPESGNVWNGRVMMNAIASLPATATLLSGPSSIGVKQWYELVDPVLNIDGRIKHDRATEYLCGQRYSRSSSLVMAELRPSQGSEHEWEKLYDYFQKKDRYAVVGKHHLPCIKDLYIVPVDTSVGPLPDWFAVMNPPAEFPERRGRMLVLIFVVIRSLVEGSAEQPLPPMSMHQHAYMTPQQPQASPFPQQPLPPPPPPPLLPQPYIPKHPMTRELINMVAGLGDLQIRAIDTLLQENPELQTKPDLLAKEVEKVLGAQQM